mmetsp:Transcript_30103/g.79536  ORF Transcript_30103/g.79536 Transcript_30103/m.79536 type:complete len:230 (+) Transcript_30103:1508-2197(+)
MQILQSTANSSLRFWSMARCRPFLRSSSCSNVKHLRLMLTRRLNTTTSSVTCGSSTTSRQHRGGNKNSLSSAYCDAQEMSAPASIRPAAISNTVPLFCKAPEYCIATDLSVVVDIKPISTPPRNPSSDFQNFFGKIIPPSPRNTSLLSGITVVLDSLVTPLMMQNSVVSYLLPSSFVTVDSGCCLSTALYKEYMGPVYSLIDTTSASFRPDRRTTSCSMNASRYTISRP